MPNLTLQQLQVVDALSNGASLTAAAAEAGIHRNTIANWRRESNDFREALATAQYDRALLYRDRTVDLADLAFETLRNLLTDPQSSLSIRLRAATFIVDKVVNPPKVEKEKQASMTDLFAAMTEFDRARFFPHQPAEPPADAQNCTTMHNDAPVDPAPRVSYMHNSAQEPETYRRPEPKIGRNQPCPCGSGKKYKHCCLNKSAACAA